MPEKHEKKIIPKPKVPAKIEEPPPTKGMVLSHICVILSILTYIIMPLCITKVLSGFVCKHFVSTVINVGV